MSIYLYPNGATSPTAVVASKPANPTVISVGVIDPTEIVAFCPEGIYAISIITDPILVVAVEPTALTISCEPVDKLPKAVVASTPEGIPIILSGLISPTPVVPTKEAKPTN